MQINGLNLKRGEKEISWFMRLIRTGKKVTVQVGNDVIRVLILLPVFLCSALGQAVPRGW
jgi:hypothetical protein